LKIGRDLYPIIIIIIITIIIIIECIGQGEKPNNMKQFWRFLLRKELPADSLQGVRGLGSSPGANSFYEK
jgi:sulfite reductase alpha subunit-like flavoprotein